jgi:hypothetical protein
MGGAVLLEGSVRARAIDTATLDHDTVRESLEYIAANLRPADLAEVRATVGSSTDTFWALFESWEGSVVSWLIVDETGLPIGVMGVSPHLAPKVGIAWLLGTPGIEDAALSVGRQTRRYVGEMQQLFPILWANVDARNDLSMRWLTWAGFNVIDADPTFGPESRLFLHFVRTP